MGRLKPQWKMFSRKFLRLSYTYNDILCSAAFKTHHWIIFSLKLSITPDKWAGIKRNTIWLAGWWQEEYKEHSKPNEKPNRNKNLCIKTNIWEGNPHTTKSNSKWQQSLRHVPPLLEVAVAVSDFVTDCLVTGSGDGLSGRVVGSNLQQWSCCWHLVITHSLWPFYSQLLKSVLNLNCSKSHFFNLARWKYVSSWFVRWLNFVSPCTWKIFSF